MGLFGLISGPPPGVVRKNDHLRGLIWEYAEYHRPQTKRALVQGLSQTELYISTNGSIRGEVENGGLYCIGEGDNLIMRTSRDPFGGPVIAVYTDWDAWRRSGNHEDTICGLQGDALFEMALKTTSGIIVNPAGPDFIIFPFSDLSQQVHVEHGLPAGAPPDRQPAPRATIDVNTEKLCPNCRCPNPKHAETCSNCEGLFDDRPTCPSCARAMLRNRSKCMWCGYEFPS